LQGIGLPWIAGSLGPFQLSKLVDRSIQRGDVDALLREIATELFGFLTPRGYFPSELPWIS
jgi:hypothetical protein